MAGIFDKIQKMWNPPDDEYDEYYEDVAVNTTAGGYEEEPRRAAAPVNNSNNNSARFVSINRATAQVRAFQPISFGTETSTIADELNSKNIVVLNLEKTEKAEARRILDFLSGVAYANDGKIKRVSTSTYIITPYNVDYSGTEVLDELEHNSFTF